MKVNVGAQHIKVIAIFKIDDTKPIILRLCPKCYPKWLETLPEEFGYKVLRTDEYSQCEHCGSMTLKGYYYGKANKHR